MRTRAGAAEVFEEVADDLSWTKAKQIQVLLEFIEEEELAGELQDYLEELIESLRKTDEEDEDAIERSDDSDIDLYGEDD